MHIIVYMHAIPPIWHTHRGENKKKVQLELNMCFDKLMPMTTSTCLDISADTMHQHVTGLVAPKTTMHMLSDELDGGAISVYLDAMEEIVCFNKTSSLSTRTPSWMPKIGIILPPSTFIRMSKSWSHHNSPVSFAS